MPVANQSLTLQSDSSWQQSFDRARRRLGMFLGPLVLVGVYWAAADRLDPRAQRLAAVLAAVVVFWICEVLPLAVTAMLGACGCVLLDVAPAKQVFAPFADPIMFLFIGSFMMARAIFEHGLDRRLALSVLASRWVGGRPSRVLLVFGAVAVTISAWISNTATTAMMLAIALSILKLALADPRTGKPGIDPRWATGLLLMTSFAASIGGLATPIGTPPNLIGLGFIGQQLNREIPFFRWMMLGVPVVAVLYLVLYTYLNWCCPAGQTQIAGGAAQLARQRSELGPWTPGQRSTAAAFSVMVALWIVPGLVALVAGEQSGAYAWCRGRIPEGVAALLGAALLFVLPGGQGRPALTWPQAAEIDWGVVLLYGGGFSLGVLSEETGLADAMGRALAHLVAGQGSLGLLIAATCVATLLSELTSNTASAVIVVPLAIATARATGHDPLEPALAATMAASLGFMMPVSTPCNAIVYGSGYIRLGQMMRYGLLLDLAGIVTVVVLVRLCGGWMR